MPFTYQDWFCMKSGRNSFLPKIPEDAKLIFCHGDVLQSEILSSIEASFARNEPIKMLVYGDWGVGKTHVLYHVCYWLETNRADYPAKTLVIEIGDLTRASRFNEVVRPFLDRFGLDEIIKLVHDYRGIESNVVQALRDAGVSAHIADAFSKLLLSAPGSPPAPLVVAAFDYLKGRNLGKAGSAAGLGEELEQSKDFYDVLLSIGEMYKAVHKCRLLFIADEAAKLEAVEEDMATQQHWLTTNKLIFADENRTFGFIYTISGRRSDLPRALFEPQIQNRLGDNVFELPNLQIQDVESYFRALVDSFVDKTAVEELVAKGVISKADYDWDCYPFTAPAKSEFIDYFNRTSEDAKPRDISKKLDAVAFVAGKKGKRLIDEDCLRAKNM